VVSNRQIVESYAGAMADDDFDAQDALVHDDYELVYPQSGERFRGRMNRRAVLEYYPGREQAGTRPTVGRIVGRDDQWLTAPSWPGSSLVHVIGSGDDFQVVGTVRYPDGQDWHFVSFITLRDGKVWRETTYFAPPFEAPAWRAPYVERGD
jgi:ketosteroid isomerase-like protein